MKKQERANVVLDNLNKFYPNIPIPLKHKNVYFINPYKVFCKNGICQNLNSKGIPFYSDGYHLSKTGSIYLFKHIKNELLEILGKQNK